MFQFLLFALIFIITGEPIGAAVRAPLQVVESTSPRFDWIRQAMRERRPNRKFRPLASRLRTLQSKLNEREKQQKYPVRPQSKKHITFANPDNPEKTPYSIVVLHGFSASRPETTPLAELISDFTGSNLFQTRLTGHGIKRPKDLSPKELAKTSEDQASRAMGEATAQDWVNDAHEALEIGKQLGEKVILVGHSTGGTLATWLAATQDPAISHTLLYYPHYGLALKPMGFDLSVIPNTLFSSTWVEHTLGLGKKIRDVTHLERPIESSAVTFRYPFKAVHELQHLVNQTFPKVEKTKSHLLAVHSPYDKVVDPKKVEQVFDRWGEAHDVPETLHKQRNEVVSSRDRWQHMNVGGLSPETTENVVVRTLDFLKKSGVPVSQNSVLDHPLMEGFREHIADAQRATQTMKQNAIGKLKPDELPLPDLTPEYKAQPPASSQLLGQLAY